MEGKRRIMSSIGSMSRKRGKITEERKKTKRIKDKALGENSDEDQESYVDENEEEKIKRIKREKERIRRLHLKSDREERYRVAAEKRERNSTVPAKRPRKPIQKTFVELDNPRGTKRQQRESAQQDQHQPSQQQQRQQNNASSSSASARSERRGRRAGSTRGANSNNQSYGSRLSEADMNAHNAELKKAELQVLALESQLIQRDMEITSLKSSLLILEGNIRFMSGRGDVYSKEEAAIVEQNAKDVIHRIQSKPELDSELHECVLCHQNPASTFPASCMCMAYCPNCVPKKCALCLVEAK
jgi:hypothetical protein